MAIVEKSSIFRNSLLAFLSFVLKDSELKTRGMLFDESVAHWFTILLL